MMLIAIPFVVAIEDACTKTIRCGERIDAYGRIFSKIES